MGGVMLRILLRGFLLACSLAGTTSTADAADQISGPFPAVQQTTLATKWQDAKQRMAADEARLSQCRAEAVSCSVDMLRFDTIVAAARERQGRARIGEINRAVNLAIRPVADERQYGVMDHWSGPLETIYAGAGDCEDYAILKLLALQQAGIARQDLRLLIVKDNRLRRDHAVAAVRLDGRWLVLDNRGFALVDLALTHYRILAQLDPNEQVQFAAFEGPVAETSSRDVM